MRTSQPRRKRKATKRFDIGLLAEALRDGRQWAAVGLVEKPSDGGSHYRVETDGGTITDILVEVTLKPSNQEITCRLANAIAGGGLWRVPSIGDEVVVVLPAGAVDFMPCIVGILSGQSIPDGASDSKTILVASDTIEITAPSIVISNGGAAEPLVTKSQFDAHTHPTGTGPSGVPSNAATSGTTVLTAE